MAATGREANQMKAADPTGQTCQTRHRGRNRGRNRVWRSGQGIDRRDHAAKPQKMPPVSVATIRSDGKHDASHEGGGHLTVVGRVYGNVGKDGTPPAISQGRSERFAAAV